MSMDFDSAALQTQHEEEEYDQEDYAREQELHKLLTDLPDDMLEDSRDDSSPDLDYSVCINQDPGNRQQPKWSQQSEWSDHQRPASHPENAEENYDRDSYHNEYTNTDRAVEINGHASPPQSQPLPHTWTPQAHEGQYNHGGYRYPSVGTENDLSAEDGYQHEPYTREAGNPSVELRGEGGQRDEQSYVGQNNVRAHFQNIDSGGSGDRQVDHYKASYKPCQPASQPKMFNSESQQQDGHFDLLQREFLDTAQNTADNQELAQLQILYKAQLRQVEDLEHKLEDSRRSMRYLEHQFAIVRDEKDGMAMSLKESGHLIEEAQEREVQLQRTVKSLEQKVLSLTERDHESLRKQRAAEAAVDSMQQQMMELRRSDVLSRAREKHDRDMAVVREQHEAKLLVLQQKLDSCTQASEEQREAGQRLREQVKQLEHQREEEQVERARIVNTLTQRLEQSQQQCAKLLQTGSVQEMSQMQIRLHQAQSAKTLSENMNQVLQEDLNDLKEQITLYESAVKHGVITLDLSGDVENHLSDSYVDLGIKKENWKNGLIHSTPLADLMDPKLPKDEALRELKAELQRCLASLRDKRQRVGQLQEELHDSQALVAKLHAQLEQAQLSHATTAMIREANSENLLDSSPAGQKELLKLQEDHQRLLEHVQTLEKVNKELKQNEEKVRAANTELCSKMREMIQELDQEKQEAAERYERTQQQYRDDVVNRVRAELTLEHTAELERLSAEYQQQIQQLQCRQSEMSGEMLAVQECYIAVCGEKDALEEDLRSSKEAEAEARENELKMRTESGAALEKLRGELETEHQAAVDQLQNLWSIQKETEVREQVHSQMASAKAVWQEEREQMERAWGQRLEVAVEEARRKTHPDSQEEASQTEGSGAGAESFSREELDSRICAERLRLLQEADVAKRKAVEDSQREMQEKHLENMAKQVEGAVTRAHSHWIEDLTSLQEYKANLQRERAKWEELQEEHVQAQVALALRVAKEQWQQQPGACLGDQGEEGQRGEKLQKKLVSVQSQLEQVKREQAALLKAELAGARAVWNRDRQQEMSSLQTRHEQDRQALLQEQRSRLEQAVQTAREESELLRKQLFLQKEAELQQALRDRQEEWRVQTESRGQALKQQGRKETLRELQAELAEVQALLLREAHTQQPDSGEERRTSAQEGTMRHILQSACRDMISKAVGLAKEELKRMSEDRLGQTLKDAKLRHEKEVSQIHKTVAQTREEGRCGKQCAETVTKLQKKNRDLQRHLEKACRQLQRTVRENQANLQRCKEEHKVRSQKEKEEHLQNPEGVKQPGEPSGGSENPQNTHAGLEEMKEQYMKAVGKIRGDMLRYLQESRERASEMIRVEVLRERQDTARTMRRYYLTCLQELLEEGGQSAGAEKKVFNAASKLVAMAKVLETPTKNKSAKDHTSLRSSSNTLAASEDIPDGIHSSIKDHSPEVSAPETKPENRPQGSRADGKAPVVSRTRMRPASRAIHQDLQLSGMQKTPKDSSSKPLVPPAQAFPVDFYRRDFKYANVTLKNQNRDVDLQGVGTGRDDDLLNSLKSPFLVQETPVRDEGQSDWSLVSNASLGDTRVQPYSKPNPGRGVETVKPFPLSAASSDEGEFGGLTVDHSDMTVYREIANIASHTKASTVSSVQRSTRREPIQGSQVDSRFCASSKVLFSEMKLFQQDSGFDSPFAVQK